MKKEAKAYLEEGSSLPIDGGVVLLDKNLDALHRARGARNDEHLLEFVALVVVHRREHLPHDGTCMVG